MISMAIIFAQYFLYSYMPLISLVTYLRSPVVGNCTNVLCEGGQHCNATKDEPDSFEAKNNCNDGNVQGNDRVLIFHRSLIKTCLNLVICYMKINTFVRISPPLILTSIN